MTSSQPILIQNQTIIFQAPPKLTVVEAVTFRQTCLQAMESAQNIKKVILDFGQTAVIDSSGIGSLVSLLKSARAQSLPIVAWSLNDQIKLALSLAGLDQVLVQEENTESIIPGLSRQCKHYPPSTHPSVRSPLKRGMDILGAIVGLSITGLLFIPIAVAIRLESPGPILFSQTRCGLMGRRFRIWKFRSMVTNAEALKANIANQAEGAFFKNDQDPRVTRVGKFLRKTSLDELPQFWNVLRGEMSLIGTRPPTPDEIDQYDVPNWQRLDVKPGMSGEWQVNGRSKIRDFAQVIQLDLRYQQNWSLVYDVKLILKTLLVVFNKDAGAV